VGEAGDRQAAAQGGAERRRFVVQKARSCFHASRGEAQQQSSWRHGVYYPSFDVVMGHETRTTS